MGLFDRIPRAFRLSGFRRDPGGDVRDEIDFYIEMRARELIERGMEAEEARRVAAELFGDRERIEAETLRVGNDRGRGWETMGDTWRGVRQAIRSLLRRPGFTVTVLVTLALGIGGSTTMFTVVDSVLFRPLPYFEPDRLVSVMETNARTSSRSLSPLNYLDARRGASQLEHLAAFRVQPRNLLGDGEPERLVAGNVSANFFAAFGVQALLGRTFTLEPSLPGESRTAVLTHALWMRRFGGDPGVLGSTILLDQETVVVSGVMPPTFRVPEDADLWIKARGDVPEMATANDLNHLEVRDAWYFQGVGRLRPGVTLSAAQAELDGIASRIREIDPESNGEMGFRLTPLRTATVESARTSLLLLLGAVGLVLLIACTNVANLMLVRSASRSTELGVRAALGAGRGGLIRHLLTESAVLGLGGAVLGTGIALLGTGIVRNAAREWLPRAQEVAVGGWTLLFAVGTAGLTVLLFGALPILSSSRVDPREVLSSRGVGSSGPGARRLRGGMVVVETALALVLVLAAGLTLKSVWTLSRVDLGFEVEGLATLPFMIPGAREMDEAQWQAQYGQILERVEAVSGVRSAALATRGPVSTGWQAGLRVEGREFESNNPPDVGWQVASVSFFETAGVPVVEGRGFLETDGPESTPVAVVNETLARTIWPTESAVGQRINTGLDGMGVWVTVVGVVADTRNRGPMRPTLAGYYRPLSQPGAFSGDGMMLTVRTTDDPAARLADIQAAAWSVNPNLPFYRVQVEDDIAAGFTARPRFIFWLLGAFAVVALTLGAVGIHGVTAFAVEQRTRELGIRIALGADRRKVLTMVLAHSFALVAAGLMVGLGGALALSRVMRGVLHEVSPTDPGTYLAVAGLFLVVSGLSAFLPARRASRVDPLRAMATE